jgi:hypothetical protein
MISTLDPAMIADDLRFALETMDERSHLGLNDAEAERLRSRILARLYAIEDSNSRGGESVSFVETPN